MGGNGTHEIQILLVEDNPGDVRLTIEALKDAKVANVLHHVANGEEALEFVMRRGEFSDAPRPDLILLDLNLPRMNGTEVLEALKTDTELRRIPVIVLTTSSAERDILHSYDLHANCFVTKPLDFAEFIGAVRSMEQFWLAIARLPQS
jgi:CheY-like chemotaxis protein